MVLLDEALTAIVNFIDDSVDKGQMGTGGTASASSDTGLEYPDAATLFATTSSISDNQVVFTYIKPSTTGAGTTYREYEYQDSVNAVNFTRYVFTPLEASASEDWNIKVRIFVRNV